MLRRAGPSVIVLCLLLLVAPPAAFASLGHEMALAPSTLGDGPDSFVLRGPDAARDHVRIRGLDRLVPSPGEVYALVPEIPPPGPWCAALDQGPLRCAAWADRYDGPSHNFDGGNAAVASADGTTVFATGSSQGADRQDMVTLAYDAATGARRWVALWDSGVPGSSNSGWSVAVTPDGSTVVAGGWFSYTVVLPGGGATGRAGRSIVAYDALTGAPRWADQVEEDGAAVLSNNRITLVGVSSDGQRAYVAHEDARAGAGPDADHDFAVAAYDVATGQRLWTATYDSPGHGEDIVSALAVGPEGTVYAAGLSGVYGSMASYDFATLALDGATGARKWVARYDSGVDVPHGIAVSPDGRRVLVGGEGDVRGNGNPDFEAVLYDAATGEQQWAARYDGHGTWWDAIQAVTFTKDGTRAVVSGISNTKYLTIAYDVALGLPAWVQLQGASVSFDWPWDVQAGSNGRVYVTGWSMGDYGTVAYEGSSGNPVWLARYHRGSGGANALAIAGDRVVATGATYLPGTNFDVATVAYAA